MSVLRRRWLWGTSGFCQTSMPPTCPWCQMDLWCLSTTCGTTVCVRGKGGRGSVYTCNCVICALCWLDNVSTLHCKLVSTHSVFTGTLNYCLPHIRVVIFCLSFQPPVRRGCHGVVLQDGECSLSTTQHAQRPGGIRLPVPAAAQRHAPGWLQRGVWVSEKPVFRN